MVACPKALVEMGARGGGEVFFALGRNYSAIFLFFYRHQRRKEHPVIQSFIHSPEAVSSAHVCLHAAWNIYTDKPRFNSKATFSSLNHQTGPSNSTAMSLQSCSENPSLNQFLHSQKGQINQSPTHLREQVGF